MNSDVICDLNVDEMLRGHPTRLRYVQRFSTSRVHRPESVAEHSYYVALYSMIITRWYVRSLEAQEPDSILMSRVLERALLHDLEEAVSGDFPRPFKHSSPRMKKILDDAGGEAMGRLVHLLTRSRHEQHRMHQLWREAKDDTKAGLIVSLADFLSVLSYLLEEAPGGLNVSILRHVADMQEYFYKFTHPKYDFLRPIIRQASVLMNEMFERARCLNTQLKTSTRPTESSTSDTSNTGITPPTLEPLG